MVTEHKIVHSITENTRWFETYIAKKVQLINFIVIYMSSMKRHSHRVILKLNIHPIENTVTMVTDQNVMALDLNNFNSRPMKFMSTCILHVYEHSLGGLPREHFAENV